jgi:hypothetical protein
MRYLAVLSQYEIRTLFRVCTLSNISKTKTFYFKQPNIGKIMFIHRDKGKGKGKAIPLQAWTGPEGSKRRRLPGFKTIGT